MAMKKSVKHPFKTNSNITDAYIRMKDFAFDVLQGYGRIGYAVYKDAAARAANAKPYPMEQKDTDVIFAKGAAGDTITAAGLKDKAITEINAHKDLADLTKTTNGFIKSYTDEFGETHAEALFSPVLISVNIFDRKVNIEIGIWATEAEYLAGQRPIPGGMTYTLEADGADAFISALDGQDKGRKALYAASKSNALYATATDI